MVGPIVSGTLVHRTQQERQNQGFARLPVQLSSSHCLQVTRRDFVLYRMQASGRLRRRGTGHIFWRAACRAGARQDRRDVRWPANTCRLDQPVFPGTALGLLYNQRW